MERLDVNQLLKHPFITNEGMTGLKFDEMIKVVHIIGHYIVLVRRYGGLYFVDGRTLQKVSVSSQSKCVNHTNMYSIASFGDEIGACGGEGQVSIWKIVQRDTDMVWQCVKVLESHSDKCTCCVRMSDKYIASLGLDKRIVVHSRGSWKKVGEIKADHLLPETLHSLSLEQQHPDNKVFVPGTPDQLSPVGEVQIGKALYRDSMILHGNQLTVADGDTVKQFTIMPNGNPKITRQMQIANTHIKSICMAERYQTGQENNKFWLGTEDGRILRIDMQKVRKSGG